MSPGTSRLELTVDGRRGTGFGISLSSFCFNLILSEAILFIFYFERICLLVNCSNAFCLIVISFFS